MTKQIHPLEEIVHSEHAAMRIAPGLDGLLRLIQKLYPKLDDKQQLVLLGRVSTHCEHTRFENEEDKQ